MPAPVVADPSLISQSPPSLSPPQPLTNRPCSVSGTHANPLGIKTDAPWEAIWDVMRCWVKDHPVKTPAPGSAGERWLWQAGGRSSAPMRPGQDA